MSFNFFSWFDQRGGVWVGISTCVTILLAILESIVISNSARVIVSFKAPSWWVSPTGIYFIILGFFVLSKSGSYFIDSKYNSPIGSPPEK